MIDFSNIPNNPGCYLFKSKKNRIIYVGKAKNLKKRVKSYFQKKDLDPKTEIMVKSIDSVDFIVTHNEVEAIILENNLI
ncbi:MAG: GIY-YIG nuclease family protein, partial [Thermoplasmata archaeon]